MNPTQDFGSRIREITYNAPTFKNVEQFKAAFEKAVKGAHGAAEKKFRAEAELILYLAQVQSFLSERGANADLRKAAGIKAGFEEWYETFRARYDVEYAFKTVQHKIAQLRGGCDHCGRLVQNDSDHKKSCILYRTLIEQAQSEEQGAKGMERSRLDMKGAANAHYADRYLSMVGLLTNAPKDATPQEIFETLRAEAQSAYEDLDAELAKKIKVPKLVELSQGPDHAKLTSGIEMLKAENDSLKHRLEEFSSMPPQLRDERITTELAAEPDRGEAGCRLTAYLTTVVNRVLPSSMSLDTVNATVKIAGQDNRIMIGDWLAKQGKHKKDSPITLAECTGIGECEQRRRVREWDGKSWGKEHVVYNSDEASYRVVPEAVAREIAPEAFPPATDNAALKPEVYPDLTASSSGEPKSDGHEPDARTR